MDDVELYAERASSSLFYLVQESLQISDEICRQAASHVGVAVGLCTLLRGTPYHIAAHSQTHLPAEILASKGITLQQLLLPAQMQKRTKEEQLSLQEGLRDVVYEVAAQAHGHLQQGMGLLTQILQEKDKKQRNNHVVASLLPAVKADIYLKQLQTHGFDVFAHEMMQNQQLRHQFRLMKALWTHKLVSD